MRRQLHLPELIVVGVALPMTFTMAVKIGIMTGISAGGQPPIEHRLNGFFRFHGRGARNNLHAILLEKSQSTKTHAAGNNMGASQLVQPRREYPPLVLRRIQVLNIDNFFLYRINIDNGKYLTMTEMGTELTVLGGNCYFHCCLLKINT